jgi:hypothetical protein
MTALISEFFRGNVRDASEKMSGAKPSLNHHVPKW